MDPPGLPTILAYSPFDPKSDADRLHKAIKGLGTDEKTLVDILTHRNGAQRKEIAAVYRTLHKKQLLEDIKSDTSGNFYRVLQALLQPPELNDAQELHHAIKGLGTDEDSLQEILFTRTNTELQEINNLYFNLYKIPLAAAITNDTSGDFRELLLAVASGVRVSGNADDSVRINADAKALHDAGPKRLGTNVSTYKDIFATRLFPHLRQVFQAFESVAKMTIEEAIKSEMSGDTQKSFLALEKDLGGIAQQYQSQFGETLEALIEKRTTSDYRAAMLEILKEPR